MVEEVDMSNGTIMEALNNKADIDLNNLSVENKRALIEENKETIMGWMMPEWERAIEITETYTNSNPFIAPCDGLLIYGHWSTTNCKIFVNDIVIGGMFGSDTGYGFSYPLSLPLLKGDRFYQEYANNTSFPTQHNRFIPFKGAN